MNKFEIGNKKMFFTCFAMILLLGIFLRTYKFSDWLIFSPDQARDAMLINRVLEKKQNLPLLGPQAGNTTFSLGPLYYEIQFVSAKIFNGAPEALAYPDLLFSILAIPLLFFFLRKYFNKNISLALMIIMSFSYFAISNSRFASNPNSIPFFVILFLFSLLEMMRIKNKKSWIWPALLGLAIGVGVQLHTLLLVIMPAVALVVLGYLIKNKLISVKSFAVALVMVLVLNTGQIIHEIDYGGQNTVQFFKGMGARSKNRSNVLRNASLVLACQVQANAHIISSAENIESCGGIYAIGKSLGKTTNSAGGWIEKFGIVFGFGISFIFSIGGYALLGYFMRKEGDCDKKKFLQLVAVYNLVAFLVMIPVATEISMRFLIILLFVPFVLLGLWMQYIANKIKSYKNLTIIVIFGMLIFSNSQVVFSAGMKLSSGLGNSSKTSILGETRHMTDFILSRHMSGTKKILMNGKKAYLKRFFKPLEYIVNNKNPDLEVVNGSKSKSINSGAEVFYVQKTTQDLGVGDSLKGHVIKDFKKFNKIEIFVLSW